MARAIKLHEEKNPAVKRIADMLVNAFNEIGEKIRKELRDAYRHYAAEAFLSFMKAIKTRTGELKRDHRTRREEYSGWHRYAELDREKAPPNIRTFSIRTWEDYKSVAHLFTRTYKYADQDADEAYERARDSFVHKNLDKIRNVLGSRSDLKSAVIKFDWRGGYFRGNMQVYLEGAYFRGDVDIKYVIRTIPRVTPYFQYPLLFVEAEVSGKHYNGPSEDELRVLLGATKSAAEEKREAAVEAGVCPMSGQYVPQALLKGLYNRMSVYVTCPSCKAVSSVNKQSWKFRSHKTPGAERAGAAQKLETAGYCAMSREKVSADTIAKIGPVGGYSDPKIACEKCGQMTRLDARKDWDFKDLPEGAHATRAFVTEARYYKHKLAPKANPRRMSRARR